MPGRAKARASQIVTKLPTLIIATIAALISCGFMALVKK